MVFTFYIFWKYFFYEIKNIDLIIMLQVLYT